MNKYRAVRLRDTTEVSVDAVDYETARALVGVLWPQEKSVVWCDEGEV